MTENRLGQLDTRRLRSAFLLSATVLGGLAGTALQPRSLRAQQLAPEVEAIVLDGVNSLDPAMVRRSIATKASRCRSPLFFLACRIGDFDWAETRTRVDTMEVRRDADRIATLYEVWGFPDAQTLGEVVPQSDGDVIVKFRVNEGLPIVIRDLTVRGAEAVPGLQVPASLPLKKGEPYALPRLENTQRLLRTLLAERGYPLAEIEVSGDLDHAARTATVILDVQPGRLVRFGSTRIRTQRPVEESVVRKRIAYLPGDPFSLDALVRTERNLYALPIVERTVAEPTRAPGADTIVDVAIEVEAREPTGFSGEALLSSTDCAEVRGLWQHRYFLGGPRMFVLGVSAAKLFAEQVDGEFPCTSAGTGVYGKPELGIEADLRQFIGRDHMLIVRAYADRESSPGVYVQKGYGGELALARSFSPTFDLMLGVATARSRLSATKLYFCGQYGVCTAEGTASLSDARWLSPIELTAVWNSTAAPPDLRRPDPGPGRDWVHGLIPMQRLSVRASVAGAGTYSGSDYTYQRALAEVRGTRLLGNRVELAGRMRAGWITGDGILPPQTLLYSGGPSTVRGYAQNLLGPKVLLTRDTLALCTGFCLADGDVDPAAVTVRPTGGERVLEGNLEARLWLGSRLQVAAFLDAGRLAGSNAAGFASRAESNITPGIGLRVLADVGPIRVDLGYDPSGTRQYPLFTEEASGDLRLLRHVRYNPFTFDRPGFFKETFRRLQIHLAVGQAF
ncbi:MAG: BamA/TamA family outer membrane protein [Gemmatimonadota bacterium]